MPAQSVRRTIRFLRALATAALLAALVPITALASDEPDPADAQKLVEDTTHELLEELRAQAAAGEIDPEVLKQRVDELVKPHLDFVTMTRLAVGRHWRSANDDQKRALVEEFRELIVNTYSSALEQVKNYDGQDVEFLPLQESEHPDRVEVRSRVVQPDGARIPVHYGLRYTDGAWKLYDIVVDGISLVTTYRSSFSSVVNRDGIDGLIEDLREKNESGETEVPGIEAG